MLERTLFVSIAEERLYVLEGNQQIRKHYVISTAKNGAGEQKGSEKTPRGAHIIRALIGQHAPINAVFVGRRWTGEIFSQTLSQAHPHRDWILSRILWLSGTQIGQNRLGEVDTMQRYIYIHGAPEHSPFGTPASHGCIRMHNADIIELFNIAYYRMPVFISEKSLKEYWLTQ